MRGRSTAIVISIFQALFSRKSRKRDEGPFKRAAPRDSIDTVLDLWSRFNDGSTVTLCFSMGTIRFVLFVLDSNYKSTSDAREETSFGREYKTLPEFGCRTLRIFIYDRRFEILARLFRISTGLPVFSNELPVKIPIILKNIL